MSIGQQIESAFFASLLQVHGETLTLRTDETVQALVRRPEEMTDADARNVNFSLRESSIIQVAAGAISPAVNVGELLTDEGGKGHRIQKILPAPGFLKLICKVA